MRGWVSRKLIIASRIEKGPRVGGLRILKCRECGGGQGGFKWKCPFSVAISGWVGGKRRGKG